MRSFNVHRGVLSLALVGALAPAALAQQPAPTIEATVKLENTKSGSVLHLEGKAPNLPDGTKLHVRMIVADVKTEATFFMTPVTNERFRAVKTFNRKTLAPLPYVVTVELILGDQRQAIARLIRLEYGLPSDARVILGNHRIEIGSLEEQAEFRLETIHKLLAFSKIAKDCVGKTNEILAKPAPADPAEWKKVVRGLAMAVRPTFTRPFAKYKSQYVVIHERTAMSTLGTCMSELNTALTHHKNGETAKGKARMARAEAVLGRLEEELQSRLPKKSGGEKKGSEK